MANNYGKHTQAELREALTDLVLDNGTDAIAEALSCVCNIQGRKAYTDHGRSQTGEHVARLWGQLADAFGSVVGVGRVGGKS